MAEKSNPGNFFHRQIMAFLFLASIWLIGSHSPLMAQEQPDIVKIDSLTYNLYLEKRWDDLIAQGENALKNGVDFYYLQMRVAIAWYEKKNYRHAIPYFENALKYDQTNQIALEYLYFSYLFSGREYDMRLIYLRLSDEVKKRNNIPKQKVLHEIYLEGAYGLAGNQSLEESHRKRYHADTIYSETWYYNQLAYIHAGAKFNLLPRLSLYQGYSRLTSSFSQDISYQQLPIEDFQNNAVQDELYGNMEIVPAKGWKITPAWHYCWVEYMERDVFFDSTSYSLGFDTINWAKENFTLSLSLKKDISNFTFEAFGVYSDFELKILKQTGLAVYFYPYGNTDLYTKTSLEYVWYDTVDYWVFNQLAGVKLAKKTWLEAEIAIGNLRDYAEKNAYVIYNAPEEINLKGEVILLQNLNKHLDVSLRYRYMQRENKLLTYTNYTESTTITTNYPYHTFIAGLTWRL